MPWISRVLLCIRADRGRWFRRTLEYLKAASSAVILPRSDDHVPVFQSGAVPVPSITRTCSTHHFGRVSRSLHTSAREETTKVACGRQTLEGQGGRESRTRFKKRRTRHGILPKPRHFSPTGAKPNRKGLKIKSVRGAAFTFQFCSGVAMLEAEGFGRARGGDGVSLPPIASPPQSVRRE